MVSFSGRMKEYDMAEQLVKVIFELDRSEWHGHDSEGIWTTPIAGTEWRHFRLLNSPFFAMGISYQDVVKAKPVEHELLFEEVVERGGHSTYMLILEGSRALVSSYWRLLENLGCSYESGHIKLSMGQREIYSVDVPPSADIYEVYELLERGEKDKVWLFQEGYAHLPTAPP
jgi:hypothetical protein